MQSKPSLKDRIRYQFDNLYSRGTGMVILSLGLITLFIILVGALVITFSGLAPGDESGYNILEAFWVSMLTAIGSGSIGGRETAWPYRLMIFTLTLASIFITSFLISALTNGMVTRVSELKKGRSKVIESGHTVILGWSEQVFTIISELMCANASEARFTIVVLGNLPKEEMEEQIKQKVAAVGRTKVVCRTGDPMEMADLKIVSLDTAKNVIIVQPETAQGDADVIKIVLAIVNNPARRKDPYHIVAGIRNPRNYEVARVAGKDEVRWIVTSDLVARVLAQTNLQPGLSAVYDELFDFADNEIYLIDPAELAGVTFGEALFAFDDCMLIGVCDINHDVTLNPPPERVIRKGERLIVVATDDKNVTSELKDNIPLQSEAIAHNLPVEPAPRQVLILGWNWRGAKIVQELDHYIPPGSEVTVIADTEKVEEDLQRECSMLFRLKVCYYPGDTDDRQVLEGLRLQRFDHIILLGYSDTLSPQRADAKSLVTLLHLRDIKQRDGCQFTVVTELMDLRNYALAATARADDYVVSDRLVSLYMAQVAENAHLHKVFQDLLDTDTSEIYLKSACLYVEPGRPVNFYTVIEAARRRSEVTLGFRTLALASDPSKDYGVVINPPKGVEVTFSEGDKIIVIAQN